MKQMKIEEKIALVTDICELNQLIEKYEFELLKVFDRILAYDYPEVYDVIIARYPHIKNYIDHFRQLRS